MTQNWAAAHRTNQKESRTKRNNGTRFGKSVNLRLQHSFSVAPFLCFTSQGNTSCVHRVRTAAALTCTRCAVMHENSTRGSKKKTDPSHIHEISFCCANGCTLLLRPPKLLWTQRWFGDIYFFIYFVGNALAPLKPNNVTADDVSQGQGGTQLLPYRVSSLGEEELFTGLCRF